MLRVWDFGALGPKGFLANLGFGLARGFRASGGLGFRGPGGFGV